MTAEAGVRWSWFDYTGRPACRRGFRCAGSRLDLRLDHRRHFGRFNLVSFFTLLNACDCPNLFHYFWNTGDNRQGRINQWSRIPVGGFELEF